MGNAPPASGGKTTNTPPNSVGVVSNSGAVEMGSARGGPSGLRAAGDPLWCGPSGHNTVGGETLPTVPATASDAVIPSGGAFSENSDTSSNAAGVQRPERPAHSSPATATGKERGLHATSLGCVLLVSRSKSSGSGVALHISSRTTNPSSVCWRRSSGRGR